MRQRSDGKTAGDFLLSLVGNHPGRTSFVQAGQTTSTRTEPDKGHFMTTTSTVPQATGRGSAAALWTGRIMSGIVIAFLIMDGAIKLVPLAVVTETMQQLGYPGTAGLARLLGVLTIACTLLYAFPPTAILGAILLTGYMGGAMATHL